MQRSRNLAIDLVKAAAMVGVVAQHTSAGWHDSGGGFWILQAVPVLVLLIGLNNAGSLRKVPRITARWWRTEWVPRRVRRLLVPIGITWGVSLVLGLLTGTAHFGPLMAVGVFPLSGPGNYFVPVVVQLALVLPLLWRAYVRNPVAALVGMCAVSLAFELVAPHIGVLQSRNGFLYEACALRYFAAVGTGMWLFGSVAFNRRNAWLVALLPLSVAYLAIDAWRNEWIDVFSGGLEQTTNLFAVPYVACALIVALRTLPQASASRVLNAAGLAGQASLHIFLVQIVWFGFWGANSAMSDFVPAVVAAFMVGTAFFVAEQGVINRNVVDVRSGSVVDRDDVGVRSTGK